MPLPSHAETPREVGERFTILVVCSGNICRSPLAGGLLRGQLPAALGTSRAESVDVVTAGTVALDGAPMDDLAAVEATRLGMADVRSHRARRLTSSIVERADLVLGLERSHRGAAVELDPSANRRAFTLTEFAVVLTALHPDDLPTSMSERSAPAVLAALVSAAATTRGEVATSRAISYDVEDPYRRAAEVHRRSADAISAGVHGIVDRVAVLAGD